MKFFKAKKAIREIEKRHDRIVLMPKNLSREECYTNGLYEALQIIKDNIVEIKTGAEELLEAVEEFEKLSGTVEIKCK